MRYTENDREQTLYAIRTTCVPLLIGRRRGVRRAAKLLRRYGLRSYAILTDKPLLTDALLLPLYVTPIPPPPPKPAFLSDTALHFFDTLDQNALPVLVDCTHGHVLHGSTALRERLGCRCFITDEEHLTDVPPFSYLSDAENESICRRTCGTT